MSDGMIIWSGVLVTGILLICSVPFIFDWHWGWKTAAIVLALGIPGLFEVKPDVD